MGGGRHLSAEMFARCVAYGTIVAVALARNEALHGHVEAEMTPAQKAQATLDKLAADGIEVDMKHFAKVPGLNLPTKIPEKGFIDEKTIADKSKHSKMKGAKAKQAQFDRRQKQIEQNRLLKENMVKQAKDNADRKQQKLHLKQPEAVQRKASGKKQTKMMKETPVAKTKAAPLKGKSNKLPLTKKARPTAERRADM